MNAPQPAAPSARIAWIDCAKCVAVMAVILDHLYALYKQAALWRVSYFSVSLFILLSGVTAWRSGSRFDGGHIGKTVLRRAWKLLLPYLVATALYGICKTGRFTLTEYLLSVIKFDAAPQLYFVAFYLELVLISPLLYKWLAFCRSRARSWIWHAATLAVLAGVSLLCEHFTSLPWIIGSAYLFGGTYLLVYYIGMLLASTRLFSLNGSSRVLLLVGSGAALCVWVYLYAFGKLRIDEWLRSVVIEAINPPGVSLIVYALLMLLVSYALFSLLSEAKNPVARGVVRLGSYFGRYTLYIFLYHWLIIEPMLFQWNFRTGSAVLDIVVYMLLALVLSALLGTLCTRIRQALSKLMAFVPTKAE